MDEKWVEEYRQKLAIQNNAVLTKFEKTIEDFIDHCEGLGVKINRESFSYNPAIGVVCSFPNIIERLVPYLSSDKDNLYSWQLLQSSFDVNDINAGFFFSKKFMAMANPVFRREMRDSANWSPRFIEEFWALDFKDMDAYLSLDPNRVRINVDTSLYIEADTWFGAPFNKDISEIPDTFVQLRPPVDLDDLNLDFVFGNAYSLDLCWKTNGFIKTFQALEFKAEHIRVDLDGESFHPVRYIHAEYDLESGFFRHFDGAVHYYKNNEYLERRDSNFRFDVKSETKIKPKSIKYFKLNGKISVDDWVNLTSHFFTANPLAYEYFSGVYPPVVVNALHCIRKANEN